MVLADLAEFTHFVTRVKVVPAVADDISLGEAERTRGRAMATALSMRVLSRTWQMLLKGIAEVQAAGRPLAAAEMVLVRIAYVADLPTPDEAIRALDDGGAPSRPQGNGGGAAASSSATSASATPGAASFSAPRFEAPRGAPRAAAAQAARPANESVADSPRKARRLWRSTPSQELVALASDKRDVQTKLALERDVRLVRCEDGKLEIALEPSAAKTLVNDLSRKLQQWTGRPWMVVVSREPGEPTLKSVSGCPQGRARGRRARRSAGQGGAGTFPGRGDCRRARPEGRGGRRRRPRATTCCRPTTTASATTGNATIASRMKRWPTFWA